MGEAKRRRLAGENPMRDVKIPPRKRLADFRLVHQRRVERQGEDGTVYAQHAFAVVNDAGDAMVEETPDGPKPVILLSAPQPVRMSLLASSGLVRA